MQANQRPRRAPAMRVMGRREETALSPLRNTADDGSREFSLLEHWAAVGRTADGGCGRREEVGGHGDSPATSLTDFPSPSSSSSFWRDGLQRAKLGIATRPLIRLLLLQVRAKRGEWRVSLVPSWRCDWPGCSCRRKRVRLVCPLPSVLRLPLLPPAGAVPDHRNVSAAGATRRGSSRG